jgi:hypothetical protein
MVENAIRQREHILLRPLIKPVESHVLSRLEFLEYTKSTGPLHEAHDQDENSSFDPPYSKSHNRLVVPSSGYHRRASGKNLGGMPCA